jgi:hypothetical protein
MAIARFPVAVLDCPNPESLAQFHGALLDWKVEQGGDDWWSVRAEYGDSLGFQKVDGFKTPEWPGQEVPQQMHLDVVVDNLDDAEAAVLARCEEACASARYHVPGVPRPRRPSVLPLRGLRPPSSPWLDGRCRAHFEPH